MIVNALLIAALADKLYYWRGLRGIFWPRWRMAVYGWLCAGSFEKYDDERPDPASLVFDPLQLLSLGTESVLPQVNKFDIIGLIVFTISCISNDSLMLYYEIQGRHKPKSIVDVAA